MSGKYIRNIYGDCKECPSYTYADTTETTCKSCAPGPREILLPTGECGSCPDHTLPDSTGKICEPAECEEGQIVLPDGTCETCPDYSAPLWDVTSESWSCEACGGKSIGVNTIVEVDGSCCDCNVEEGEAGACKNGVYGFGFVADANNRVCSVCTPKENEILTSEGECIPCDSYTHPNTQQRECIVCDGKAPGEF